MGNLIFNLKNSQKVAVILYEKFHSDEGIFGHNEMPEYLLPRWDSESTSHHIVRGSYEHLMFTTLVVSIDYLRNADQLWEAGRRTFEHTGTRWLFSPQEVVNKSLTEVIAAMKIHKLAKRPIQDAKIWFKISKSFFELYNSNPANLIKNCDYDALKIFNKKFDPDFKRSFPFLSGNKIFPLWIRMLHDNVGINLKKLHKIPIPVDIHIARATFTTGCMTGKYIGTISGISDKIDKSWKNTLELVNHSKLKYHLQLDEPLWHLSKYGCKFRTKSSCTKKGECPVSQFCIDGMVYVSSTRIEIDT